MQKIRNNAQWIRGFWSTPSFLHCVSSDMCIIALLFKKIKWTILGLERQNAHDTEKRIPASAVC